MTDTNAPVSPAEIADLLAWARRLADAGPLANPHERAAFLAAKATLLDRIPTDIPTEHDHPRTTP